MLRTLCLSLLTLAALAQAPLPPEDLQVIYYQKVPLRDGVNLSATLYKPKAQAAPLPALMVLTPYCSDHNTERGLYFAERGYVFVSVDCRGRGNSEGTFTPFSQEGKDGYDAVEWIAKQPWCNGKVATMGGSYKGMDQWLIAKENPPHLAAMAPTATVCPGIDAVGDRNILRTYNLNILTYVSGRTQNREAFFSPYNVAKIEQAYREHRPYGELLEALAAPPENHLQEVFRTWISHPTFDRYWQDMLPSPQDYARLKLPVLSITGYFDSDQPGTMHYVNAFHQFAPKATRDQWYFVVGPWDHSGTRRPKQALGGLDFGKGSVLDILDLHKAWFDWTLKGGPKPAFLQDHVAFFQMGSNTWAYAPTLAALTDHSVVYNLANTGADPTDPFCSGQLLTRPAPAGEASLRWNPLENANHGGGEDDFTSQAVLSEPSWLWYHSEPLSEAMELSGAPTLRAFVSIDAKDMDFAFQLFEVKSDGTSVFLARGVQRARFRQGLEREVLVKPGDVLEYTIPALNLTNRRLAKGSRLRLCFGPLDSNDAQKNYGTGGDVSFESGKDAKPIQVRLWAGTAHPSRLELPIRTAR